MVQHVNTARPTRPAGFRVVSLKEERLARKVTLAFGFMAFIPLLLTLLAFVAFVFPHLKGSVTEPLHVVLAAIIVSILIGYFVLKHTMANIMEVVQQARAISQTRLGQPLDEPEGDEVAELAKTFNRVTQELEHKIHELESSKALIKRLLARIGTALVSHHGIDNLLELILENASAALGAQKGSLMLVDGEKQELTLKTAWPVPNGQAQPEQNGHQVRLKFGEGVAGWVAKANQPQRAMSSPEAIGLANGHGKQGAVLCVPLMTRGHPIGVLAMFREDTGNPFTEDEELLLANIGSQVAVAIENYRLNLDVERTYLETILALALAVEAKDPYSAGHSKRVGFYAVKIAEAMGLDEDARKILNDAGVLHDVGKIGIKDSILLKEGALTREEQQIMEQHAVIGEAILKPVHSLGKVAELVRYHHEHYNGSGYPHGLQGEAIPLGARILTVADAYDAMMTDRPYRKRLSVEQTKAELAAQAGKQFDPQVIEAFLKVLAEREQHRANAA